MHPLEMENKKSLRCHWSLISHGEESDKTKKQQEIVELGLARDISVLGTIHQGSE